MFVFVIVMHVHSQKVCYINYIHIFMSLVVISVFKKLTLYEVLHILKQNIVLTQFL